jgi:hypothetical protein
MDSKPFTLQTLAVFLTMQAGVRSGSSMAYAGAALST